jgi:hypothetical protein
MAVQTAWSITKDLEESDAQARAVLDRIQYMTRNAGVYQLAGRPTRLGVAVVPHRWFVAQLPDVLVVWSGGRDGGMAAQGVQDRLPQFNELVVYACDPRAATRLMEFVFPNNRTAIDFDDPAFGTTILSLLQSRDAQAVLLCDRIAASTLPRMARITLQTVGHIRFELDKSPSDDDLERASPGTSAWRSLVWPQGLASSDSGLRQETVRIELQLGKGADITLPRAVPSDTLPFFGSVSCRYVYRR